MGMAAAFSTQPRRAALAPSRKELEKSARDNARAGDSCSCLLLQGVLLQGARLQPGACHSLPALLGACSWGQPGGWGPCSPPRSLLLPPGGLGPCGRGSSALPRAGTPRLRRPGGKPRLRRTAEPGRGEACDGSWSIPRGTGGTTACLQA